MLTEYLAPLFLDDPLVLVDIGARWGISRQWEPFGKSLKAFCFEADREECERLNRAGGPTFIPEVVSGRQGTATLYLTRYEASSGLYRTNMEFFGRLINRANAVVVKELEVETKTFEQVKSEYGIPDPDFIKLDVEGAELDIMREANLACVFGLYSEFRFHSEINGCGTFSEMDQHLQRRGFMLYDLTYSKQSRKALPYPGPRLMFPDGERFYASTTGGQVMDGDALYFRDPIKLRLSRNQILKAACLFETFGLNDCAAELLIDREKDAGVDLGKCLDLLAGGNYRAYMEAY